MTPESTATLPTDVPSSPAPPAKRSSPLRKAGGLIAGMVVGGALAGVGMKLMGPDVGSATKAALREQLGAWTPVVAVLLALAAGFAGIAAHELGHVIGGRLAGFRFWLYVVGPLRVERDEATGRVTVGLNREASLAGGVAASLPTDTHDLNRRFALAVGGGPAASVLLALLAWLPLGLGAPLSPALTLALSLLSLISAGLAVVTLIPMRSGGFNSDGARLLRLLRSGPDAEREAATLSLIGLLSADTPPREWPRALVDAATALRDGSMEDCFAASLAYYHALDGGDVERAAAHLERMVELRHTFPPAMAPTLDLEAAYFLAAYRGDAARARAHLAAVPEKSFVIKPYDRASAEAALALADGDFPRAAGHARRALDLLPAKAAFRRPRLEQILREAEAAEAPAGV